MQVVEAKTYKILRKENNVTTTYAVAPFANLS